MHALLALSRVEFLLLVRNPVAVFMALLLPSLLLLLQGFVIPGGGAVLDGSPRGLRAIDFLIPVGLAVAVTSVTVTNYPSAIGAHRETGVLRRLDVTPVGAARILLAQWLVSGLTLAVAVAMCVIVAFAAFEPAPPRNPLLVVAALVLGTGAMMAIGSIVAAVAPSAQAAYGIGLLIFIGSLFTAGMWTPGPLMSEPLRVVSSFTPVGAMTQAMTGAWFEGAANVTLFIVMAAWGVACAAIALRVFRWR